MNLFFSIIIYVVFVVITYFLLKKLFKFNQGETEVDNVGHAFEITKDEYEEDILLFSFLFPITYACLIGGFVYEIICYFCNKLLKK